MAKYRFHGRLDGAINGDEFRGQIDGELEPIDPPTPAPPPLIENALLNDESGNYCAWSHNNNLAFLRDGMWYATADDGFLPIRPRDQLNAVARLFMWADSDGDYWRYDNYQLRRCRLDGTQVRQPMPLATTGQWRAGTASAQSVQHLRQYDNNHDATVLGFNENGGGLTAWHTPENLRFHGLYQAGEDLYMFSPAGFGQDQTFICDRAGDHVRNIESPEPPWVHTWSHPSVYGSNVIYFAAAGPYTGDVRWYNVTMQDDTKLFHVDDLRTMLDVDFYMNAQHFHVWENRVVYSAHGQNDGQHFGAILRYNLDTDEHDVIVDVFEIAKPEWGGWPNPSQSPDGKWVAYQDGDDIRVASMDA